MIKNYNVIGLMSGTSLDGLDIAYCSFCIDDSDKWAFKIIHAETIKYDKIWIQKLSTTENSTALEISLLNVKFGDYLGHQTKNFIYKYNLQPDFIASHGHTIFHQPDKGLTLQIGSGAAIMAATSCKVINDFRTLDVALGGQGAPLVPIGDRLLFNKYDFCINLGGFANISFEDKNQRIAFDICPANIVFNYLTQQLGLLYDDKGKMASEGQLNEELFNKLELLSYYHQNYPKSLGKEWVLKEFIPILNSFNISIKDKLRTVSQHISSQLKNALLSKPGAKVFVTGGAAYNTFLINTLKLNSDYNIIIPEREIIDFKEALIFAFLGVLRMRGEVNCLQSVTGASRDSCGGFITSI